MFITKGLVIVSDFMKMITIFQVIDAHITHTDIMILCAYTY